jgi:hypothetical protein
VAVEIKHAIGRPLVNPRLPLGGAVSSTAFSCSIFSKACSHAVSYCKESLSRMPLEIFVVLLAYGAAKSFEKVVDLNNLAINH